MDVGHLASQSRTRWQQLSFEPTLDGEDGALMTAHGDNYSEKDNATTPKDLPDPGPQRLTGVWRIPVVAAHVHW